MRYALNLAEDGRILSVTYEKYAPAQAVCVEELPKGSVADYRFAEGEFIYDPLQRPEEPRQTATKLDVLEAQVTYTAMMTDTLLEVGI